MLSAANSFPSVSRVDGDDGLPNSSLPSFWTAPSEYSAESMKVQLQRRSTFETLFKGWRLILFGSWLNVLLMSIPISWVLNIAVPKSHLPIFILCTLALVPLVKLHDLGTSELALRIGGAKAGLINASLSNIVGMVVAITALRKCELTFLQSALMGSMLSKLLLVLGLCFFAGGLRFSEQDFDPTATQVHCSLLSISVGALILPAAYHFSLSGAETELPEWQKRDILRMSHGVSIALLFIYFGYLIFQLWSHSHLYNDKHNKKSRGFFAKGRRILSASSQGGNKRPQAYTTIPVNEDIRSVDDALLPPERSYSRPVYLTPSSSYPSSSQVTLHALSTAASSNVTLVEPTVRLVHPTGGYPMTRVSCNFSGHSIGASTRVGRESQESNEKAGEGVGDLSPTSSPSGSEQEIRTTHSQDIPQVPRVSWPLAMLLLVLVTAIATVTADWLVEAMDPISNTISKEWVGFVLLPAVTAIAECMTAVNVSVKGQLTLSISVAVGSSIQTALFVIPSMVSLGWVLGKPLSLLMDPFQSLVLYLSVQTVNYVVADGKSNWLEGMILITLYIIIAVSFWFYPGSNLPLAACVATDVD
ncbi:putative Ca(2) cation antiporter (CaCA) (TC 2.A.19) family protein [Lyophyllum shimeji]|uniref:Ca(2) cation antiporter (CaCA) (TC 2.A.19) family protein n=1 Tax=Lyophyllum shimeji TaxID=47721 RepID=A0A9P3UQN9_LYOSH|nr:putative Ca(2) cation antiporter (CaCA) (TC 2.A.19) family protein [Lyophyllum shimeji]